MTTKERTAKDLVADYRRAVRFDGPITIKRIPFAMTVTAEEMAKAEETSAPLTDLLRRAGIR